MIMVSNLIGMDKSYIFHIFSLYFFKIAFAPSTRVLQYTVYSALGSPITTLLVGRGMGSLFLWASPIAQWVKNPPATQETQEMQVRFLGWEDPLEKGMTIYSNILAWRIPWTKEPGRLQSKGPQRVEHN